MKITQLNHVSIEVRDHERSAKFYAEIIGLARLPRPAFNFPGAWFRLGKDQELHLIQGDPGSAGPKSGSRSNHFAVMVDSIDAAAEHLRQHGVIFTGPKKRPDGASQIFFDDPDGHTIEFCTPPA